MGQIRFRSAVAPLRRSFQAKPAQLPSVDSLVAELRPAEPLHCIRPATLRATARRFVDGFATAMAPVSAGGDVLYAVKCNPDPAFIRQLWKGGVRHYDCASPAEIRLIRQMFGDAAQIHYMHPVKNRAAIRAAYLEHEVRDFSLDSVEELAKILEETAYAGDLGLMIRLALPKGNAAMDLSGKFGASRETAVELLRRARVVGERVGVCFHVGSQMMEPAAYERALELAGNIIREAGVEIDVLDVGGGFPVSYPDFTPPPLDDFMAAIRRGVEKLALPARTRVWCEPGRALVAAGGSIVVQVERRRGDELFINDGVYGSLSDAGVPAFRFPCRLVRPEGKSDAELMAFSFWGPTCDSADRMKGPFLLPADIREGDWIEIGQLGAYGATLRTAFNGFDVARMAEVADAPLLETPGHRVAARLPEATR
ncbi:type III PLP-dependent enzyme [Indioceanicola profundi]|uniref:type III PLP-dependent enzyme n=1 Tax=Indioceanicola profundi TaxID=2220096 RepID=UPI000E6A976B|nr:type III PLP-dependent enzyme [Indioceanicola profundi]